MITELDPVPRGPISGAYTTRCQCGWEVVHILPEEMEQRIAAILVHLQTRHALDVPLLECTIH